MNKIILIIFGIFLLSFISALTYNLIAGESQSFDLGEEFSYYSIVGNSTPININISQEGTIVTITPDKYSLDDTFELIFFNKEKEVISGGGGGGGKGRTVTIVKNQTIEVPIYVDRNVTVTKEVPSKPEEKIPTWILILTVVLFILLEGLYQLIVLLLRRINQYRIERGLKK